MQHVKLVPLSGFHILHILISKIVFVIKVWFSTGRTNSFTTATINFPPNLFKFFLQPGTVHVNSDCTFRCKCIDGVYTCFNITCSENAVCELQGSFQDCYCNEGYTGDGLECYAGKLFVSILR